MATQTTTETVKAPVAGKGKFNQPLPSLDEIRACIPKECFDKDLVRSVKHLLWDYAVLLFLYKVQPVFESFGIAGMLLWYFVTGMELASVFVCGHDCGHGTFSKYIWVNDIFGHITHGMLFAPYWPWQKTHRLHHTYTSHVKKDHGHPWITEEKFEAKTAIERLYSKLFVTGLFNWYIYTIAGLPDGSHFWPYSRIFSNNKERIQCVFSGLVCVAWASLAYYYFGSFGGFVKFYIIPIMFQGFWIIMITYLQHQTDDIEVYEDGTWGYVKGQLQTIDRPYGFGIDQLMHHITDGHVAHHLFFTQIPHYNLMKATEAIEKKLNPLGVYRKQTTYDFLWQFFNLNCKLEYLIGEGTGLLKYAKTKSE